MDAVAVAIMDTAAFQRLRYIRQLGLAHLVYPGATHTRFDHALGVYHLAQRALDILRAGRPVPDHVWHGAHLIPYAALLHDIGHYAFSHALEELEPERIAGDHEEMSARFFESAPLKAALEPLGAGAADEIFRIIRGEGGNALRGLVSGSLDLDKMEYLRRDARFCGVPYGDVDVERLLQGLALLRDPVTGQWEVGLRGKAVSTLESLLFSKYQMFRTVYWHHAVRAATGLYKRIVETAVEAELVSPLELIGPHRRGAALRADPARPRRARSGRGPPLRALAARAARTPAAEAGNRNPRLATRRYDAARVGERRHTGKAALGGRDRYRAGARPGRSDPRFPRQESDVPTGTYWWTGEARWCASGREGMPGLIDLPSLAEELYRTARVLRLFTFERREVTPEWLLEKLAGAGRPEKPNAANPVGIPG